MLTKTLKILGIAAGIIIVAIASLLIYTKAGLPDVGAAPDIHVRATPVMIRRGAYLANHVTVCIDCHSKRDWTRFAGPVTPGTEGQGGERFDRHMGFPGIFYAKNITPANLKDWSDGEIYRVITTGVTKEGEALFPVMPYHYYGMMDPRDVTAIISYLRTLKPIAHTVPERTIDFPMNFIVNTIPQKAHPIKRPPKSDTLAYGHYLVEIAGCQECHTQKVKGKPVGPPFAGGWAFHMKDGSIVRTANLTPDRATGIGNWSRQAFIARFKAYSDSTYAESALPRGQMQTPMPWVAFSGMDSTDLGAIYAYLHSLKPVKNKVVRFTAQKAVAKK